MADHANSSYASYGATLERLFGDKLEPARRPVEEIFARAHNDKPYTMRQHRDWLRGATAKLEELGLIKRDRPGGKNSSVTHLVLLATGKRVLGDTLARKQREAAASNPGDQNPRTPPQQGEATFDDLLRPIERYCERRGYHFEWTITNRKEATASK